MAAPGVRKLKRKAVYVAEIIVEFKKNRRRLHDQLFRQNEIMCDYSE